MVLAVAALAGRFIDRGALLTTQAGVQAIVIVGLSVIMTTGGPLGRWTDALVGGGVALGVATLGSTDPRRRPREQARNAMHEIAAMLRPLSGGLRADDPTGAEESLVRGRASEPVFAEWQAGAQSARDIARVSPGWARYRDELTAVQEAGAKADHAMRNARVLARRTIAVLGTGRELIPLAEVVADLADASVEIASSFGTDRSLDRARTDLLAIAARMDPFALAPQDWQAQSLVLLLRSLVVDLMEVAGVSRRWPATTCRTSESAYAGPSRSCTFICHGGLRERAARRAQAVDRCRPIGCGRRDHRSRRAGRPALRHRRHRPAHATAA